MRDREVEPLRPVKAIETDKGNTSPMSIPISKAIYSRGSPAAQTGPNPRFDYQLIRIEGGHLDYSRTFFAHPAKSR